MNKIAVGLILGAVLGALDGASAWFYPEVRNVIASIMVDRKSTRLNSSHLVISYAVFCFQKKGQRHRQAALRSHHKKSQTRQVAGGPRQDRNRGPGQLGPRAIALVGCQPQVFLK